MSTRDSEALKCRKDTFGAGSYSAPAADSYDIVTSTMSSCRAPSAFRRLITGTAGVVRRSPFGTSTQCRVNHVADVANATGLRSQGGGSSGSRDIFFSPSVVE